VRTSTERRERGDAMVVWCMLLALMFLPIGGISVDLWHGIEAQRQLEAAAEDAATAGSSGIDVGTYRVRGCLVLEPALATSLAYSNLAAQDGLGSLSGTSVEVSPDGKVITVRLQEKVRLTLLSLVEGLRPIVVTATASSGPKGSVPEGACS
jgi:Flp pilus assembly protein TadG